jgi:predicted DsbA family dithiol-disulfide isomerase
MPLGGGRYYYSAVGHLGQRTSRRHSVRQVPIIEVFADVRCPFTHVGLRRFVDRREELGRHDVRLLVRAWPLELVNGKPLDPDLIDEEVAELRTQVAPDLFGGFSRDGFAATSIPALQMAAAAYAQNMEAGEQVSLSLRWALFEEGRDIADPAVLADIAANACIPIGDSPGREAVLNDWREGQRRGVVGSPHFFVAGETFFCPSLDITRDNGRLRIRVDHAGLEAFLARCF